MNEFGLNEDQFWLRSPAAAEIFEYQQSNSEFSYMGFDSGGVSRDRRSTYAFFSGVALSGLGKDHVTVSASLADNGSWTLTHTIKRA